jgi:hypothetical protein
MHGTGRALTAPIAPLRPSWTCLPAACMGRMRGPALGAGAARCSARFWRDFGSATPPGPSIHGAWHCLNLGPQTALEVGYAPAAHSHCRLEAQQGRLLAPRRGRCLRGTCLWRRCLRQRRRQCWRRRCLCSCACALRRLLRSPEKERAACGATGTVPGQARHTAFSEGAFRLCMAGAAMHALTDQPRMQSLEFSYTHRDFLPRFERTPAGLQGRAAGRF